MANSNSRVHVEPLRKYPALQAVHVLSALQVEQLVGHTEIKSKVIINEALCNIMYDTNH